MLTNAINTIVFDFTCNSEIAAKNMRNEIINYKASQISSILSEVLSEEADESVLLKINKIEIDLGNIDLEEIGTNSLLGRFKDELSKNLDDARLRLQEESGRSSLHSGKRKSSELIPISSTVGEAQLDIIKELLLSGDLPWWLDKNIFSGMDETMEAVIQNDTELLASFLKGQKTNLNVIRRIRQFFSPVTILKLNDLLPGIINLASTHSLSIGREKIPIERLSDLNIQKINDSLISRISTGNKNIKLLMIKRLLKEGSGHLIPNSKLLGALTGDEIATLELFFSSREPGKLELENALQLLQRLNFFQLEFLSYPLLLKSPEVNEKTGAVSVRKQKAIRYITNKLKTENILLQYELNIASEQTLHDLQKLFTRYQKHRIIKERVVAMIIDHPYFLKYKVLHLFASLSFDLITADLGRQSKFGVIRQRLIEAQTSLQKVLKGLTKKQALTVTEIFLSGVFPSLAAKKTITDILKKLPDKSLLTISVLLQLNKKEIENLVSMDLTEVPPIKGLRKTIIENAGLCLLAPYLPAFFDNLGYVKNGKFKTKASAHRALYVLQYIVNGRQRNYEYVMQLNKLLCGLNIDEAITGYKRLTNVERNEVENLIISVITHWKVLTSTSQKGFQMSFLQRKGILTEEENVWTLQVEKKGYDVLLDSIPWSFKLIKFPWMNKMIQVEW